MNKQATYIFVHGAWHGAWCWEKLTQKMTASAFKVLTPDLPGHGCAHLSPSKVTFDLYVNSLIELIDQQTQPVILLGHSMAGMVISQVAEEIPDKIAKLIYLAAYLPSDGDSLLDLANRCSATPLSPHLQLDTEQKALILKNPLALGDLFYHLVPKEEQSVALKKLQAQPFEPFKARVRLGKHFLDIQKEAILCEQDRIIPFQDQKRMSLKQAAHLHTISSDHSPFLSAPDRLMEIITDKVGNND